MAKVVVIGIPGETELWLADLGAGTVSRLPAAKSGALAEAQKLRHAGATITKGVDLAVVVSSKDAVASGQFVG
jgi:hypothetical protein